VWVVFPIYSTAPQKQGGKKSGNGIMTEDGGRRRWNMCARVSASMSCVYEHDWQTPPLHYFITVKRCAAAGREGGHRCWGGKEVERHLPPAIGHQKWENTVSQTMRFISNSV